MINGKKVLVIIPARGGSKRLPRKNILPLCGKPLIGWTIEAAKNSIYVDSIFISTDDSSVAKIAREYEVNIPELRPKELATDSATTEDVLIYTLNKFGSDYDIVALLQPSSPLRTSYHLDDALELFVKKNAFSIVSVTPCEHSPLWSNTLPANCSMSNFLRPEAMKRSQELETFFRINGALYIFDIKELIDHNKICYTEKSFAYIMKNEDSVDIDNEIDFRLAKVIING
ncbi:acylneuraminate cytidylyltransferase family protein [Providencia sp. PROV142]|uniref:acylneuraminate cytidylyltransferase family protein n=1 Tax=Providencia sp. PROV142 TaxID=2949852 RepID=UPI00234BFA97|nr:acylneuraminate cytidylyltransferase family protein [Providencia sp. PROV142]